MEKVEQEINGIDTKACAIKTLSKHLGHVRETL